MADSVVLSRYFSDNVRLISGACARCHEENDEVKIVSINFAFLKQFGDNFKDIDTGEDDSISNEYESQRNFGFDAEEVEYSKQYVDKFKQAIVKHIRKATFDEYKEDLFKGFSKSNVDGSRQYLEKIVRITYPIYRRIYSLPKRYINKRKLYRLKFEKLKKITGEDHNQMNAGNNNVVKVEDPDTDDKEYDSQGLEAPKLENDDIKAVVKTEDVEEVSGERKCKIERPDTTYDDKTTIVGNAMSLYNEKQNYTDDTIKCKIVDEIKKEIGKFETQAFIPPKSPHNLLEESLSHDPWALLVSTIFLNKTSCLSARPYVFWFLEENPQPSVVMSKYPRDFEKYFVNLGLQRTRAVAVWRMTHEYLHKNWRNPSELFGIGEYGDAAYRMFCLGDFSVQPKDRFLRIYKAWYEKVAKSEERHDF